MIKRLCPLCGLNNSTAGVLLYSRAHWELKECAGCRFVYLENPPGYKALSHDFAWEQTYRSEMKRRAKSEPVLFGLSRTIGRIRLKVFKRNKLRRLLQNDFPAGNFLDVGCGSGGIFYGWEGKFVPHGVEISNELARQSNLVAQERGGFVVNANAVEGVQRFPKDYFPTVVLCSFLEHELNPTGLLKALRPVMAPRGRMIIKVPNYGCINRRVRGPLWCGFRFPDHVNYFTPQSLRRTVTECGFVIRRFGIRDHFPLSDSMWMIAERVG
jgi:2-polyprenyl-3-methyl-5-hydroxy-6-metoxy-1,4-benzoquinol methylase